MQGLSKTIKYRKYIIRPVAVGAWRHCEISYPGGEPFGETEAYPDIAQAVRAAKDLVSDYQYVTKMAYFDGTF